MVQEEAGQRRITVTESLAAQNKPQRKGVISVLNFIRAARLAVWAEPAPELGFLRWERSRRCLMGQEIFLPNHVFSLSESLCSLALPGEQLLRLCWYNIELGQQWQGGGTDHPCGMCHCKGGCCVPRISNGDFVWLVLPSWDKEM